MPGFFYDPSSVLMDSLSPPRLAIIPIFNYIKNRPYEAHSSARDPAVIHDHFRLFWTARQEKINR